MMMKTVVLFAAVLLAIVSDARCENYDDIIDPDDDTTDEVNDMFPEDQIVSFYFQSFSSL